MTTIAANRTVMVSDSKTTYGFLRFNSKKIMRKGRSIIGAAGNATDANAFLKWFGTKKTPPKMTGDDFEALVLNKRGIWLYESNDLSNPTLIEDEFFAIGSGAMAAIAAMKMGADPDLAVELTCEIDNNSGMPLQIIDLKSN